MPQTSTAAEPAPSAMVVRPPEGLARGRYAAPKWAIGASAGAMVIAVAAYFGLKRRLARAKRSHDSAAPQSSRR